MNEADVVSQIRTGLKKLLPTAVVLKLNDMSTSGIPDMVVNHRRYTTWLEVKYLRPSESLPIFKRHFDGLQVASNVLLDRNQTTYYLLAYFVERELWAVLFRPDALRKYLAQVKPGTIYDFFGQVNHGPLSRVIQGIAEEMQ